MKKLSIVAVMLMVGVSVAFASSLSVPWYVDNADVNVGLTPPVPQTLTLIYLKNNASTPTECEVSYNAPDGTWLGPDPAKGELSTFIIPANSTLLYRPVAKDDNLAAGGQESAIGALIPDRPRTVNTGKNGSITIRVQGGPTTVQGAAVGYYTPNATSGTTTYGFLLPPGS